MLGQQLQRQTAELEEVLQGAGSRDETQRLLQQANADAVRKLQAKHLFGVELLYCGHLWGPGKVSCIERCPHFRNKIRKAYLGHSNAMSNVSLFQGCPLLKRRSTVHRVSPLCMTYTFPVSALVNYTHVATTAL